MDSEAKFWFGLVLAGLTLIGMLIINGMVHSQADRNAIIDLVREGVPPFTASCAIHSAERVCFLANQEFSNARAAVPAPDR